MKLMTEGRSLFLYILAWGVALGFFVILFLLYRYPPQQESQSLGIMIGGLVSGFTTVVMYFFGSSRGSKQKDEQINTLVEAIKDR